MALTQAITLDIGGDRELFERVSKRLRRPRDLMLQVGVLGASSAVRRLSTVLSQEEDAVRTGRLGASLTVATRGRSGPDTIFELSDDSVAVGTNLRYAAQVQFGGRIEPATGKALAIPLNKRLKRSRLWPRDLDPGRELLDFVPISGGASGNVIGLLVDSEGVFGPEGDALYALASYVDQKARPFLFWDDDDMDVIENELMPAFLGI